ncbi:MAG: hypothetical protein OEZ34_04565 [Spirochaetia bacterium]|nr:hypothetical protein [Spirochaetia bacterium]
MKIRFIILLFSFTTCLNQKIDPQEQKQFFDGTSQENLKPTKWDTGDTTITNEDRLDLFEKHIKGKGGGYIGVGSSQNLSLIAWAQSDWVWLMDFTRIVVAVNTINIAFIKESDTPEKFRSLWSKSSHEKSVEIIKKHYGDSSDYNFLVQSLVKSRPYQLRRFKNDDLNTEKYKFSLWLYDIKLYSYIRKLALEGRIRAVMGDLRGPVTVGSISDAARRMQIPVRLVYFSNAEEYFDLTGQFKENWTNLPVDETSVIVRTVSVNRWHYPWAPGSDLSTDRGFHYNIQPAINYQKWLASNQKKLKVETILKTGEIDKKNGFSIVDSDPGILKTGTDQAKGGSSG